MTARTRAPGNLVLVVAVTAAALAACGRGGDDGRGSGPDAPPATASAEPTGSTVLEPEELAVTAYNASWDATFRALDPPQELPEIRQLMTGEALSETLSMIGTKAVLGNRVDGSMQTHPRVVSATASEVVLADCAVENSVEYDARGEVVDPADGVRFNYLVTVVMEEGVWKVSDFDRRDEPCTPE
jgi:hypothetical protein